MANIKLKKSRSSSQTPALAGASPKDLDGIKKQIAEMVLMHRAIRGKKMKSAALNSNVTKDGQMSV